MLDRIITYSFYTLFFLTPLFWTSFNFELFEYNKMILVYGFTVVIVGAWILKSINQKSLTINRTPLDIPLLLFLGANILSTIFSIDTHTSIWGYYSRSNGGLLSIISYLLLYWAFVSNIKKAQIKTLFYFAFASGLIVSVWGIFEHFGVSASCVILHGQLNVDCWVQDVQARVFGPIGQPNWMAQYLAMLIFPAIYFLVISTVKVTRHKLSLVTCYLLLVTFYLAFTFTYSRGPTLGLIGGMLVFIVFYLRSHIRSGKLNFKHPLTLVLISFLLINVFFGSALTSFRLVSKFAAPARPAISLPTTPSVGTQLENGGTESGQIRLIVWQGALDIFKAYPIFGSGVETFAYSYYQFRPLSHNLVSEWDFLYNKAHNEYLNYLATTGIVGFAAYMAVIGVFLVWAIRKMPSSLVAALLAAYISYLIYNIFLFSVVVIAVFFFLFPAIAFVATGSLRGYRVRFTTYRWIKIVLLFAILYLLFTISKIWYADTLFAKAQKISDSGNPIRAYNLSYLAAQLNPGEPLFRSELGHAAAFAANALLDTTLKDDGATLSSGLKKSAATETEKVLKSNPKNVSFYKTAMRTYFELASLDDAYIAKALEAVERAITLAPTDPKLYYSKGLILKSIERETEAKDSFNKALELKPNYLEAKVELEELL